MDAILGALEGAYDLTGAACSAAGLSDFDLAMSNQAALIESQGLATRSAIDTQTSVMQSEAATNRTNQAMMFYGSGGYGGYGGAIHSNKCKHSLRIFYACLAVFFITWIAIILAVCL